MLELLLLSVVHDRLGLLVGLDRDSLLVPADRLRLLLEGGDDSSKGPDFFGQLPGWLVILLGSHLNKHSPLKRGDNRSVASLQGKAAIVAGTARVFGATSPFALSRAGVTVVVAPRASS